MLRGKQRRMAVERDLHSQWAGESSQEHVPKPTCVFDESGNFLLYPTLFGVKVVNIVSNRVARLLGKVENTERFICVGLYQVT